MEKSDDNSLSLNTKPQSYGRYKVLELLGEGAMGRVFLSEDPILKRRVAVKVISTDRHLDPVVLNEYLGRFAIEAQACAKLNHQSIVSIYDAGEENGVPWIAFEYVNGERLDKLIARQKQLPFQQVASIAGDIAQALHHAHSMNIVHRDVKPANILIDDNTKIAKLADFGVVKSPFTTLTQDGTSVGSPGYMSPEQIDGTDVDNRSDIFSFGIMLYEMLTGAHPFLRDTVQATFFATVNSNY
ncbi:MAG: serine/threonine protein kinase, partial [Chitinispirillales bacterium]|nr:serine/threonine protein kinase [Chitinispirillales bacterium]